MDFTHLGQGSIYAQEYNPGLLQAVPRIKPKHMPEQVHGFDLWWAYEVSWLNPNKKPMVAVAEIVFPADSKCLIESKSLKLYLNSLNMQVFAEPDLVSSLIAKDLSELLEAAVTVKFKAVDSAHDQADLTYNCLDDLDVKGSFEVIDNSFLKISQDIVSEKLVSHLLKSNCLVTNQPDWGSVFIEYTGPQIDHHGLLQYIISFRNHNGFHEQCVDLIFADIMAKCQPELLQVRAQYTRRGGLDINPIRSNTLINSTMLARTFRQ